MWALKRNAKKYSFLENRESAQIHLCNLVMHKNLILLKLKDAWNDFIENKKEISRKTGFWILLEAISSFKILREKIMKGFMPKNMHKVR